LFLPLPTTFFISFFAFSPLFFLFERTEKRVPSCYQRWNGLATDHRNLMEISELYHSSRAAQVRLEILESLATHPKTIKRGWG